VQRWGGHSFELLAITETVDARSSAVRAEILLDGKQVYEPAITKYLRMGMDIGTPSVRTGFTKDVYLTIDGTIRPVPGDTRVTLRVFVKPMIMWLWIGAGLMAVGTLLAAFPGQRRRLATDPVSAPVPAPVSDPVFTPMSGETGSGSRDG
jgi:cytochrome c-type biogenesis protein CcmF